MVLGINTLISLLTYDLFGNEIKTLVKEKQNSGTCRVQWDGKNNKVKKIVSSLYIYRWQAGSFIEVKKLLFVKKFYYTNFCLKFPWLLKKNYK